MNKQIRSGMHGVGKLVAVVGGLVTLGIGGPVVAQTTWTNTASGASGYWTNGVLWGTTVGNYPGSGASTSAALTNNSGVAGGTYTNVLNAALNSTISTLTISNGNGGEAWLIVTNGAANPTVLTNSTFVLNSGGRLQIDNGGVVTGATAITWSGTNGTIILNSGGKLFSTANLLINSAGITDTVTSATSAGGTWNMGGGLLNLNNGGALVVSGVTVTNLGSQFILGTTVNSSGSSVTLSNGAQVFTTAALIIGFNTGATSNQVNIGGLGAASLFNNLGQPLAVGSQSNGGSPAGSFNSLTVSNATMITGAAGVNNSVIGWGTTNNTVNVLAGGTVVQSPANFFIGGGSAAAPAVGNLLNINGGIFSNTAASVFAGVFGGNYSNGIVVANGGTLYASGGVVIGNNAADSNNYFTVGSAGATSTATIGGLTVGNAGAGANMLTVTNAALATTGLTLGSSSSNNTATIQANSTVNFRVGQLSIGAGTGNTNTMTVNNAFLTNSTSIGVGVGVGARANSLTISNGVQWYNAGAFVVGNSSLANNNTVWVGGLGAASLVTNSVGEFDVGTAGNVAGVGGSFNTVTITNAALFAVSTGNNNGIGYGSTNNTVNVLAGGTLSVNPANFYVGTGVAGDPGTGNLLNVNGGTFTLKSGSVLIGSGVNAGVGNGVTVSNGGVLNTAPGGIVIGNSAGDTGNYFNLGSAGAASSSSNAAVTVGNAASGFNTMTVTNATLYTTGLTVGNGSSNNTVTILGGSTINQLNGAMIVGAGAAAGNIAVVDNAVLTNFNGLIVGNTAGASGNRLTVINGTTIFNVGAMRVGQNVNINSNTFNLGGLGAASLYTNTSANEFEVGAGSNMAGQGGNNNTLNVSNAVMVAGNSGLWSGFGFSSSNNTVNVLAGGFVTLAPYHTVVGSGTAAIPAFGNSLNIVGGTVSNLNAMYIGGGGAGSDSGAFGNAVSVSNGGTLISSGLTVGFNTGATNNSLTIGGVGAPSFASVSGLTVGNTAAGYNFLTVTNGTLVSTATTIGSNSSNNIARVQMGGTWNMLGSTLTVGTGSALSNSVFVQGGTLKATTVNNNSASSLLNIVGGGGLVTNVTYTQGANSTLQYTFTSAPSVSAGISTMTVGGTATRAGTLNVGLQGGVGLFTTTNTAVLLTANATSGSFALTNRGAFALSGTATEIDALLDPAQKRLATPLLYPGPGQAMASPGFNTGWFEVSTNGLALGSEFGIELAITNAGATASFQSLVDYLSTSGLQVSYANTGPNMYLLDLAYYTASTTTSNSYFAWDFSPVDTHFLVTGAAFVPEPSTIFLFLTGGLLAWSWRRKGIVRMSGAGGCV